MLSWILMRRFFFSCNPSQYYNTSGEEHLFQGRRECRDPMRGFRRTRANVSMKIGDVIMGAMASQFTSLMIVYSTVYSATDQRKRQSSAPLAFVRGIYRWPVNSPHKGPVMRKMFPFDDVIMHIQSSLVIYNASNIFQKVATASTAIVLDMQGLYSLRRRRRIGLGIPMINRRRSSDRLKFTMGVFVPVIRRVFLVNRGPGKLCK